MKSKLLFPLAAALLLASCGQPATPASSEASQPSSTPQPSSSQPAPSSEPSSEPTSEPSSEPGPEHQDKNVITEPVTITFWSNFNDKYQGQLENFKEAFKEIEPNVTVDLKKESGSYTDVKDKVVDNISTGAYPDIFIGYPDSVQEIMQYDAVVQLDEYMDDPVYGWTADEKDDVIEAYIEEGQGYPLPGTWSLPIAKSTECMYYNRDILIGLDLTAQDATINEGKPISEAYLNDLTWEELFGKLAPAIVAKNESLDADHKILKSNADYTTTVFGYDSDDNLFITLAEQYGYGYTSVNTNTGKGSIDFVNDGMKSLLKTFNAAHNRGEGTPYFFSKGTNKNNYTNYTFTAGCSLFSIGSTGGQTYQRSDLFDTGVAKIPHAAGKAAKVINQGPSLAILDHKDDNRALASWLFYKFITNEVNAALWSINTGYSPIRYSTLDAPAYAEYSNVDKWQAKTEEIIAARVAKYVPTISKDLFTSPVFKGSAEARTQVGSLFTQVVGQANITDEKIDELFNTARENVLKKM